MVSLSIASELFPYSQANQAVVYLIVGPIKRYKCKCITVLCFRNAILMERYFKTRQLPAYCCSSALAAALVG